MNWLLIQVGQEYRGQDEQHAKPCEYDSDDAAHGPSRVLECNKFY